MFSPASEGVVAIQFDGSFMYIMYTKHVIHTKAKSAVPAPFTVKARGRQGTESLDLTIPAELKREHGISEGDVFLVSVNSDGSLSIDYERIHESDIE